MRRSIPDIRRPEANRPHCFAGWILALGLIVGLGAGSPASAFIPSADRTMAAIARVNRASGRSQAIRLELTMRIGEQAPVASGELISHPTGLARLELRGYGGRIDRYLLSGDELLAAKGGRPLDRPQPMLQPFFLLQPSSRTTLRAALKTFGVSSDLIGLASCGEQDCFVIGDPRLTAPLAWQIDDSMTDGRGVLDDPLESMVAAPDVSAGGASADSIGLERPDGSEYPDRGDDALDGPSLAMVGERLIPRLWVDTKDLQVRRIDRANGVFVVFGPIVNFEKLRVPGWFEIHEPGAEPVRFDVDRAVQVNAPPQAFSHKWLYAPMESTTSGPLRDADPGNRLERVAP